jgi:ABC-type uncharacterized transport system substrate-binding protein
VQTEAVVEEQFPPLLAVTEIENPPVVGQLAAVIALTCAAVGVFEPTAGLQISCGVVAVLKVCDGAPLASQHIVMAGSMLVTLDLN